MRQMYENEETKASEEEVMNHLCLKWSCSFSKMPIRYNLDYVLSVDKKAVAFCEVKTRNYEMEKINELGGYLMSLGKWMAAKNTYDATNLPFLLAVKTLDGIWYAKFTSFKPDVVMVMGRTDRGDWQDIEPCVVINCNRFKKI
jgi:hypothetical protein